MTKRNEQQTRELDVFLSSDQNEFQKLRGILRDAICNTPFLTCTLMEDKGADPYSVSEASLKAVRDSDIYVGIFGREYSDTTILEYQEAIKCKKPCFAYVKRSRRRNDGLSEFLKNDLKQNFKYYEFGNDKKDLVRQLEVDLQTFIVNTLRMGIQARAEKLEKTIALISKEEKSALNYITAQDPLAEANTLFLKGDYLECLFMTIAIIEATLMKALRKRGIALGSVKPKLVEMIAVAQKSGLFSIEVIDKLGVISVYRNEVLHFGRSAERLQTQKILESARLLINSLENNNDVSKLWNPFPRIKFVIAQSLARTCNFPQVAWEIYNDSPYQLRLRIELHPILGGRDLHPLKDNSINGNSVYDAEPNSYFFSNGCFSLPNECATSSEDLILEIRGTVEDINDLTKCKYTLVPRRVKYVRETNTWFYHPQRLMTS